MTKPLPPLIIDVIWSTAERNSANDLPSKLASPDISLMSLRNLSAAPPTILPSLSVYEPSVWSWPLRFAMLKFVPFCIDASKNGLSLLIAAYAAYPLNEPCAPDSSLSLSRSIFATASAMSLSYWIPNWVDFKLAAAFPLDILNFFA